MQLREFFKVSNLMSLFRILVIPLLWYFLSRPGREPALMAFLIVLMAAPDAYHLVLRSLKSLHVFQCRDSQLHNRATGSVKR